MIDYQNGKIYKIVCDDPELMYIGSTCQTLSNRMSAHRQMMKRYIDGKGNYISSFGIVGSEGSHIVLIENHPCNSKEELLARERFHIEANVCVNRNIPGRGYDAEYIKQYNKNRYESRKDEYIQRAKQFNQQHKEQIKQKALAKEVCECGAVVCRNASYAHKKTTKHIRLLTQREQLDDVTAMMNIEIE